MSNRITQADTKLDGVKVLQFLPIEDERGSLTRLYCSEELGRIGITNPIAQVNHTVTKLKGTVRGMHYHNSPKAESKIVACLRGEVLDVAVDLRVDSATYLQWHGELLSAKNKKALYIPEGFAHGFQSLTDDVELLYFHSRHYTKDYEASVNATDPALDIQWPLSISCMSDKDKSVPMIMNDFQGVRLS